MKLPKLTPKQKELYDRIIANWFETGDNARIPTEVTFLLKTAKSLENKRLIRLNSGDNRTQIFAEPILLITTTEELKELVKEEAIALKQHALPEELANLDLNTFNPDSPTEDIYGQLTGNTWGHRAKELRTLCSKPYSDDLEEYKKPERDDYFDNAESPINCYTLCEGAKNENLIKFLKGLTNDLKL
jgi:hypothetical protein